MPKDFTRMSIYFIEAKGSTRRFSARIAEKRWRKVSKGGVTSSSNGPPSSSSSEGIPMFPRDEIEQATCEFVSAQSSRSTSYTVWFIFCCVFIFSILIFSRIFSLTASVIHWCRPAFTRDFVHLHICIALFLPCTVWSTCSWLDIMWHVTLIHKPRNVVSWMGLPWIVRSQLSQSQLSSTSTNNWLIYILYFTSLILI